ncbi:MAG: NAD(P)/FAD-dependent oxidoreductase [Lishizhenia sp.]
MEHIVIIGNGISGVTAARHIRKMSDKKITIISSESKHFFSRTALMYVYMGHMRFKDIQPYEDHFWMKNDLNLVQDYVEFIDTENKKLTLANSSPILYDKLILAVGSKPNRFGWKGQDLDGVQGLYSKQDLELMEFNTRGIKHAVVAGGGLIGIEMVEMLLSRNISVDFLVRENSFWNSVLPKAESQLINNHIQKHHGVNLRLSTELDEIISDDNGRVKEIRTKEGEIIACQFVGLTAGVSPNIGIVQNTSIDFGRGIKVNQYLETNVKDVFAIGDCAEQLFPVGERRGLEQVWYTGRMMGETVAQTICGSPTKYQPGNWFNSAKFFDIEYQTYGWVWNTLKENEDEYVYQHPTKEILLHFVFDKSSKQFKGVNTFGIRMRHEVFDNWLTQKESIETILRNLRSANFDPEFYKHFEKEVLEGYNKKFNTNLALNKSVWWRKLLTTKTS